MDTGIKAALEQPAKDEQTCTSLFLTKGGKLLLGERNYTKLILGGATLWTTPGGRCKPGETLGGNLLRELAEETGITDLEMRSFLGVVPGASVGDMLYVFAGTTRQEPRLLEPEKFSRWEWFEPGAMPKNFINVRTLELFRAKYDG